MNQRGVTPLLTYQLVRSHKTPKLATSIDRVPLPQDQLQIVIGGAIGVHLAPFEHSVDVQIMVDEIRGF
jgi:hypothetical protein